MPTAGRLVAAILYAALAYYVSTLIVPMFADVRPTPNLPIVNGCIGLILGWLVAGRRAGEGFQAAIGYGLTTTLATSFLCLFFNSSAEMIRLSLRKRYDGPSEAVVAVIDLMIEFGAKVSTPEVVVTALLGGLAAAVVTDMAGRRWS